VGPDPIVDDSVLDAGRADAGPPDCEADPLLPGCVPAERPAFAGLGAEVRIVRDADGVPHVYGETSRDVIYGAG
jgi:acyl-homoserine lactone acylase PvdQ